MARLLSESVSPRKRRVEHSFRWPSTSHSFAKKIVRETAACSPLSDARRVSSDGHDDVGPGVSLLLGTSRPSTIRGTVGSVIVAAVDRVTRRRARPHVGEEVFERLPSRVDGDPSTAVVGVVLRSRVSTATEDAAPNPVLGASVHAVLAGSKRVTAQFATKAAAALRHRVSKQSPEDDGGRAAVASALPPKLTPGVLCSELHRDQASESFTGQIDHERGRYAAKGGQIG